MRFDPTIGARISPAWSAAIRVLGDGAWHHRTDVMDAMLAASDLKAKTCSNVLRNAVRDELIEQAGAWHGPGRDLRLLRLARQTGDPA